MATECHFKNCIHHADGYCHSEEHRKDCLEIALGILCMDNYTPCDFCARLLLEKMLVEEKCEGLNQKDKVGRMNAHVGAKYIAYITDNHKRVYEKDSRTYKLNYCPVCGKLLRGPRFGKPRGQK